VAKIKLCTNDNCDSKFKCYRYMAKRDRQQEYLPYKNEVEDCWHYIDANGYPKSTLRLQGKVVTAEHGNE